MKKSTNYDWVFQAKMASWWLTWEDLEWPDSRLEAKWKKRAETFQKQGVNTVVIFGFHFRWDYLLFMDRVLEILARITDICHDHGLRLVEHQSAVYVHRVRNARDRWKIRTGNHHHVPFYPDNWESLTFEGSRLADWRAISAQTNEPVYVEGYNSEVFCSNNPNFQKAYLRQIERLTARVQIDALMSDDVQFPDEYSCACRYCRARFRDEAGLVLPPASDDDFWGNRRNPDFQKWIQLRYQWNSEHHQRLRKFLPNDVALWGCASSCVSSGLATVGFSVQHNVFHWDAVFHEICHWRQLDSDRDTILSGIAAFASIARQQGKPLVVIFYVNRPEDLPAWLEVMADNGARPWVCKQVRTENAIPEEQLLRDGFDFPDSPAAGIDKPVAGILFSQKFRDGLPVDMAEEYVEKYHVLCNRLIQQGYTVEVVFDEYLDKVDDSNWEQLWSLVLSSTGQTIEPNLIRSRSNVVIEKNTK